MHPELHARVQHIAISKSDWGWQRARNPAACAIVPIHRHESRHGDPFEGSAKFTEPPTPTALQQSSSLSVRRVAVVVPVAALPPALRTVLPSPRASLVGRRGSIRRIAAAFAPPKRAADGAGVAPRRDGKEEEEEEEEEKEEFAVSATSQQ